MNSFVISISRSFIWSSRVGCSIDTFKMGAKWENSKHASVVLDNKVYQEDEICYGTRWVLLENKNKNI